MGLTKMIIQKLIPKLAVYTTSKVLGAIGISLPAYEELNAEL